MPSSAIPAIKDGKPVVDILVASPEGKSIALCFDLLTGNVVK